MTANTKSDFLKTLTPGADETICPACGNPMSLQNKATYDMILTPNARKVVNDMTRIFRSLLQSNEGELQARNLKGLTRHMPEGWYPYPKNTSVDDLGRKDTPAADEVEQFLRSPDLLGISRRIGELPTLGNVKTNTDPKRIVSDNEAVVKTLVMGFEPHVMIGPLIDLILEQKFVKEWINTVRLGERPFAEDAANIAHPAGGMLQLVHTVAPFHYDYLTHILQVTEKVLAVSTVPSTTAPELLSRASIAQVTLIKDRAVRCLYVLALLIGHHHPNPKPTISLLEHGIPFDLPQEVVVSQPLLSEMFRSVGLLVRGGFNWSPELRALLGNYAPSSGDEEMRFAQEDQEENSNSPTVEDMERQLNELIQKHSFLQGDLKRFVDFACRGIPGNIPVIDNKTENAPAEPAKVAAQEHRYCGWFPKEEPTHPVLFIGSPGTTKSSVMLSGLTTFVNAAAALGISIRSTSANDVSMISTYTEQFFQGKMPEATETNNRFSVQLTAVRADAPEERVNFIFTDVPGEMVARSLEKSGTDPVVTNLLKYAEVIVFFYDLATEPVIVNTLRFGNTRSKWKDLIDHVEYLRSHKRGKTSQSLLLGKLIEDLRQLRDPEEIKKDVTFICVIPKADLYVGEKEDKTRFLNSFYSTLKAHRILDTSQLNKEGNADDFANLRSAAAVAFRPNAPKPDGSALSASRNGVESAEDLVEKQIAVAEFIHQLASASLKQIGTALGTADSSEGDASETDRQTLEAVVNVGLLNVIESTFRKVYLLPVSAQGKPALPEADRNAVELGQSPSQKLAEYVFITPVALALRAAYQEKNKSE